MIPTKVLHHIMLVQVKSMLSISWWLILLFFPPHVTGPVAVQIRAMNGSTSQPSTRTIRTSPLRNVSNGEYDGGMEYTVYPSISWFDYGCDWRIKMNSCLLALASLLFQSTENQGGLGELEDIEMNMFIFFPMWEKMSLKDFLMHCHSMDLSPLHSLSSQFHVTLNSFGVLTGHINNTCGNSSFLAGWPPFSLPSTPFFALLSCCLFGLFYPRCSTFSNQGSVDVIEEMKDQTLKIKANGFPVSFIFWLGL